MTPHPINSVVILGGGTAGWMTAAALSRYLDPRTTRITLVESDEIGTVGVGEATIPPIREFNGLLGIDEDEFLRATGGTIKLGIEFIDWGALGDRYFHGFSQHGQDLQGIAFHQLYLRERQARAMPPLDVFSLAAQAARLGRFDRQMNPAVGGGDVPHAFHFDAGRYARFLRQRAEGDGTVRIEGKLAHVERGDCDDHLAALVLEDGRRVASDLFIDCSGFRALLIGDALGVPFEDWSRWLFCDRAVAVPSANLSQPAPFTRSTAREAGWQWRIPLQHRTGNGHVFSSRHTDPATAEAVLLANIEGAPLAAPRHLSFTAGRRQQAWRGNVVAIGLSAGFLEPLESTSIHLIQSGISKLLALFPDRRFLAAETRTYNRLLKDGYEAVRDFVVLHYKATLRDDTPFWRDCRDMAVPDSLAERLELFRAKGRIFRYDDDLFAVPNWVAVLFGQGIWPDGYDPMVDALDEAKVSVAIRQIAHATVRRAESLPPHADFLRRHCAAPAEHSA